jgi:Cys-rich protein (TIGR01571 family)
VFFYTGFIGNLIHTVPSPEVVQGVSSLCGSIGTGIYAGKLRSKIRSKYNIEGTPFMDCMMHSFASPCALCQEANEIKFQSINSEQTYMPVYTAPIDIPPMTK